MGLLSQGNTLLPLSVIGIILPVAGYFLVLGLLNSRSRPQLLRTSEDTLLLVGSLGLAFVPTAVQQIGATATGWTIAAATIIGVWRLAARQPTAWVIYNLSAESAHQAVGKALTTIAVQYHRRGSRFLLADGGRLVIRCFPLLRNASVRLKGGPPALGRQFETALSDSLSSVETDANPAGAACVLAATAMLIVPAMLAAQRAGEIVRLISDLLP